MSSRTHESGTPGADVREITLKRTVSHLDRESESVLPALQAMQNAFGYLPGSALEFVASEFETPLAEVVGVATFYEQFSLEPQGEHVLRVCMGTACHVNGAGEILETYRQELDVNPGEVTEDGTFTLAQVRCIGACSLAPVVVIDDDTYAEVSPEEAIEIMEEYE